MAFTPVVAELMTVDLSVIAPDQTAAVAAAGMKQSAVRHLPVLDVRGALVGLLSHRDLVANRDDDRTVGEIMTTDLLAVTPETPAHEAAYLLRRYQIGCLPVLSADGALVGLITDSDFVRAAEWLLGGEAEA